MSEFSVYILSVAGVVILTVLVEIVLPSGKMNKYVKGILAVFMVFVIVNPIINFVKKGINFDFQISTQIDENVLNVVKNQQIKALKNDLENKLKQNGFGDVDLSFDAKIEDGVLKIETIFVDLTNYVLLNDEQHIFNSKAVKDFLLTQTGLKIEQVVVYE